MRVAVVGLGYVGLPLAFEAIKSGHSVIGIDINPSIVADLQNSNSHVDDISDSDIAYILSQGFEVTVDFSKVRECEVIVICVPTPLASDGGPDLSYIEVAAKSIAPFLIKNQLVSLESTSYPGTTEEVLKPILESGSGLSALRDFYLIFSPERIDPGNEKYGFRNTPKVVGGINDKSLLIGVDFYSTIVDNVVQATGLKEAEMAKLLENTYRHINIALINEMARFCNELEIDIWDVIRCASTKPFGFQAFYPGPGVGGHCIPIDPNYLSHKVEKELGYPFKFVKLAEEINNSMPSYIISRIREILQDKGMKLENSKILLVGVSYKKDISDLRESPAIKLANLLVSEKVAINYWDPYVPSFSLGDKHLESVKDPSSSGEDADLIVITQDHSQLLQYDWNKLKDKIFTLKDPRIIANNYQL